MIEIASRFAFARCLKTKKAAEVGVAFDSIVQENNGEAPVFVWADEGNEFASLKDSMNKWQVLIYHTLSPTIKSSLAEVAIKTVKNRLYKAMHEFHTTRWIDLINDIITSYNSRPHKNLFGFTPVTARLDKNYPILRKLQINEMKEYQSRFKKRGPAFSHGDLVKLGKDKKVFSRGFTENFHPHTYTIDQVSDSAPFQYSLIEKPGHISSYCKILYIE